MKMTILVIGTGNILLSDEGLGVHAVKTLSDRFVFNPPVEIVDGGTMGLDLLPLLEDREKVLLVDAVDFGREPGFYATIDGDAVVRHLKGRPSVHDIGLVDVLTAAQWSLPVMPEICLAGMQPQSLELGLELTRIVADSMEGFLKLILSVLTGWGVAYSEG